MYPTSISLDIWTDIFGPTIDTDAILLSVFIILVLVVGVFVGLWTLTKNFFLGMLILAAAFIGAAVYFEVI